MVKNTKTATKLDRRQFLKISTLATASGSLIGTSKSFPSPLSHPENRFPVKITDKCKRWSSPGLHSKAKWYQHRHVQKECETCQSHCLLLDLACFGNHIHHLESCAGYL